MGPSYHPIPEKSEKSSGRSWDQTRVLLRRKPMLYLLPLLPPGHFFERPYEADLKQVMKFRQVAENWIKKEMKEMWSMGLRKNSSIQPTCDLF